MDLFTQLRACIKCGELKHESLFPYGYSSVSKTNPNKRKCKKHTCKSCISKMRNVDAERNYWLQRKYGINTIIYNKMSAFQNHKCKICGNTNAGKKLVVDHCHSSGKIRGLLCSRCNTMLGNAKDNTLILGKAIQYLLTTKPKPIKHT